MRKPPFLWGILLFAASLITAGTLSAQETPATEALTATWAEIPGNTPTLTPSELPTATSTDTPPPSDTMTAAATETTAETPTATTVEPATDITTEPPATVETAFPTETPLASPEIPATPLPPTSTEAPLPDEPVLGLLFADTFDSGVLDLWSVGAGWALVPAENGQALQASGSSEPLTFVYDNLFNIAASVRVMLPSGTARVSVRKSAAGSYTAALDGSGQVMLFRGDTLFQSALTDPASPDQWRTLRLSAMGEVVRVSVDGVEVIAVRDSATLPPGTVAFAGDGVNAFTIDDVQLWVPASEMSSLPTETPQPRPTSALQTLGQPALQASAMDAGTGGAVTSLLVTAPIKYAALDAAVNSGFGRTMAIDGNTVVIGSPTRTDGALMAGAAYIFVWDGTAWTQQAKLTTSDADAEAEFGRSVAISGDTVIVGAPYSDHTGRTQPGAAYVFVRSGSTWSQQAKLTASDFENLDHFGWSVAVEGDTALVGAVDTDDGSSDTGSVYVYTRSGDVWTEQTRFIAGDPAFGAHFGNALALNGDTVAIGAYGGAGSVYIFQGSGATWTQQAKLVPGGGPVVPGFFGAALAFAGDTLIIGSPGDDRYIENPPWVVDAGSAYVFTRSGGTWTQEAWLVASDPAPCCYSSGFGNAVAIEDDIALIGAGAAQNSTGAAYIFRRSGASWSAGTKFESPGPELFATFGSAVALNGRTVLVGSGVADLPGASDAGVFYAYQWTLGAELALTITDAPDPVLVGENLTYTLTIANNGADYASDVMVTDTLPGSVSFVSAVSSLGTCSEAGGTVTCSLDQLDSGSSATINLTVTVDQFTGGSFNNSASVTSGTPDTNPANNTATASTYIAWADLVAMIVDTPDPVVVGGTLTYTVTAANGGPDTANNVVLTHTLPGGVTFVSATPSQGTGCIEATGIVTCGFGTLAAGASASVAVVVTIDADTRGALSSSAEASADELDLNPANDATTITTTISLPPTPARVTLAQPASGAVTNTPMLVWNALTGAGSPFTYEIQIDNDAYFRSPDLTDVTNSLPYAPASLPDGRYYWRVRAINLVGGTGAWSASRYFTVDTIAPAAPALSLPADNGTVTTARPALRWLAAATANRYHIEVATVADFASIVIDTEAATTAYTATSSLPQGTYYWRVQARDAAGNWGDFSASRSFNVNIQRSPANLAFVADTTPAFLWYGFTGATRYQLQVDDSSDFSSPVEERAVTTLSYTPSAALNYGVYYWRVNVDTGAGFVPSPFYRTMTVSPAAPRAPVLSAPASGAITANNAPPLMWAATTSTAGSPFTYQVQVDNDPYFRSVDRDAVVSDSPYTPAALPDGRYYWRVRTINYLNSPGPWSASRYFTVDTIAPAAPALSLPADSAVTTSTRPPFSWGAAAGAVRYELQLGTTNPPTITVASSAARSYVPPGPLLFTTYYWRVRAIDAAGNVSDWSSVRNLRIDSPTASAPVLNRYTTTTPTVTWTPVSWALGYEIQVSTSSAFSMLVYSSNTISAESLSFTLPVALPNGTYYWRIRARRTATTWGVWSTAGTFQVEG